MIWETCPQCGGDHVTIHVREERELAASDALLFRLTRDDGARPSLLPALSVKGERIDLRCLGCGMCWRG